MGLIFDSETLSKSIKTKRIIDLNVDLRKCAKKIDVSAATLQRIETGKMPDVMTLAKICKWLGTNMQDYIKTARR